MSNLTKEQIHEIQKNYIKGMHKKKEEFNAINSATKALNQLNVLYYAGNITKSELIEGIIQCKDFMINSLTE